MEYLTIQLCGGLGSQMGHLLCADTIADQRDKKLCLIKPPLSPHSGVDYFDSLFSNWNEALCTELPPKTEVIPSECLFYFDPVFLSRKSIDKLIFPSDTPSLEGAFLHIRGGDYLTSWHFCFDMRKYYEEAIAKFPEGTHFYIFTNDVPFAKTFEFLNKIPHTFIEETDDVRALHMMSKCTVGGICANSSFSWFGAYLNPNRTLVLTSRWMNGNTETNYQFPGCIVCEV